MRSFLKGSLLLLAFITPLLLWEGRSLWWLLAFQAWFLLYAALAWVLNRRLTTPLSRKVSFVVAYSGCIAVVFMLMDLALRGPDSRWWLPGLTTPVIWSALTWFTYKGDPLADMAK